MSRILGCAAASVVLATAGAGVAQAQVHVPEFQAPAAARGLPGGTGYAPPGGAWGPVSQSDRWIAGYPGTVITYTYTSQSDASPIHATGKHYTNAQGTVPGPEAWTEFGAGTTGQRPNLPWGNSMAHPAMRFQSLNVLGAMVNWTAGTAVP